MADGLPQEKAIISGMRASCEVIVEVAMTEAIFKGEIPFHISQNQVILTGGVGEKGYLPPEYIRSIFKLKGGEYLHQKPIDYVCVYDFECNCVKEGSQEQIAFNEIVEFPVVVIDLKNKKAVGEFHTYVRTTSDEKVTAFCTELCGITDEMCNSKGEDGKYQCPTIQEALIMLHQFLDNLGLFNSEFVFLSCGDFDGNQLRREAAFKNFNTPNYMQRWINLKKVFPKAQNIPEDVENLAADAFADQSPRWKTTKNIKTAKNNAHGMTSMLEAFKIELVGKHHSGIDDTRNLASIVLKLINAGFEFNQAMILNR